MGRILFLSAMAFLAYRYIARSNQKNLPAAEPKPGTVEILPPESTTATEVLPPSKPVQRLSAAAEPDR